jgi:hypothetical protein
MCSLYGPQYAAIYECLSRWSCGPRSVIKTIFCLLFHFLYRAALFLSAIIYCIFLFSMQAVVKAFGWVRMAAVAAPSWSLQRSVTILETVSVQTLDAFGFIFLLQWKTWAIAIPACWMLYLEVREMAIG